LAQAHQCVFRQDLLENISKERSEAENRCLRKCRAKREQCLHCEVRRSYNGTFRKRRDSRAD
ncbi:hypothetical protein M9458_041072, partial [Cirrhinus mrigala]